MSSRGKDHKCDNKVFSNSVDTKIQDSRSETIKKKLPLRVQNDWSEHISSKGLIYYYNCRTEVSQWQKPDEWTLSSVVQQEDSRKLNSTKYRNGGENYNVNINSNNKRSHPNPVVREVETSPKRIKYNNQQSIQIDKKQSLNNKNQKIDNAIPQVKNSKSINTFSNTFSGINKCKNSEANYNNDDMDISPSSSPLSRGSHSSDNYATTCKVRQTFYFDAPPCAQNPFTHQAKPYKCWNGSDLKTENTSPNDIETTTLLYQSKSISNHNNNSCISSIVSSKPQVNSNNNNKYCDSHHPPSINPISLNQFQMSLAASLRSILTILQSNRTNLSSFCKDEISSYSSKFENCLSVYHISDLLIRLEAVSNNGETVNSYRSHRLQTQLSQSTNNTGSGNTTTNNNPFPYSNTNSYDSKLTCSKPAANINQIKELVKCLQDFIQENYPNSLSMIRPVSPNYSKSNQSAHYLQILSNLVETSCQQILHNHHCHENNGLSKLCPQNFINSSSSTSSPGSLKDSTISACHSGGGSNVGTNIGTNSQSHFDSSNRMLDGVELCGMIVPTTSGMITKRDNVVDTAERPPRSILQDKEMLQYISSEVTNSYRNQLADYCVQEAQIEYYKFVRLHSVLYPELACESKKLKALVRISEINTELLKQKKDDLDKLAQMLESRRLPKHLKCDYVPNI